MLHFYRDACLRKTWWWHHHILYVWAQVVSVFMFLPFWFLIDFAHDIFYLLMMFNKVSENEWQIFLHLDILIYINIIFRLTVIILFALIYWWYKCSLLYPHSSFLGVFFTCISNLIIFLMLLGTAPSVTAGFKIWCDSLEVKRSIT